jgi:hypothetical protein
LWWCTPVILVVKRLRQEDFKLQASLGYIVGPCQKREREVRKEGRTERGERKEKEGKKKKKPSSIPVP